MTIRRAIPDRPVDTGMTLVELLITMGLIGMLGTMIMSVSILAMKTTTGLEDRVTSQAEGELGSTSVSRVLRSAMLPEQVEDRTCRELQSDSTYKSCAPVAFTAASSDRVQFYADQSRLTAPSGSCGLTPSRVTLSVIRGTDAEGRSGWVLEQEIKPNAKSSGTYSFNAQDGCAAQTRVLARGLVAPSALTPVFTYFEYDGRSKVAQSATGVVAPAQLGDIASVDVRIETRAANRGFPQVTLTRVRLPSVDLNVGDGSS